MDKYPDNPKVQQRLARLSKVASNLGEFSKLQAAFQVASLWDNGQTLKIAFLDGNAHQQKFVKRIVNDNIRPLVNLVFDWNAPVEGSDMRISFALDGQAWSMVGTDALMVPPTEPTMNLGWLDDNRDYANFIVKGTGQVVVHEFCHALGMIHEHQNPSDNPIVWNKEQVYADLAATNGWSTEQVDHNIFKKYGCMEDGTGEECVHVN
ncbi:MAG: zinc metalloprotease, partial [Planctomycetota bacterium]